MTIYLHAINEKHTNNHQDNWVEIDLATWKTPNRDSPIGLTLLRRLAPDQKQPYLQELMFQDLYKGLPIEQLKLEIPCGQNGNSIETHLLKDVKVINYALHHKHPQNKQAYEKIILTAKSQQTI